MQKVNVHSVATGGVSSVTQEMSTPSVPVSEIYKHLNFKVSPEFHREFKTWAASHDMSMTAVLMESFSAFQRQEQL